MPDGAAFTTGVALFFFGVTTLMVVVFLHGGAQKSKQFQLIGEIASGKAGRAARAALWAGFAAAVVGMCTTFAGVSASDRARAKRCFATCRARGYEDGTIRASVARDPNHKNKAAFVACACTRGRTTAPLELRADSL